MQFTCLEMTCKCTHVWIKGLSPLVHWFLLYQGMYNMHMQTSAKLHCFWLHLEEDRCIARLYYRCAHMGNPCSWICWGSMLFVMQRFVFLMLTT
eukprot:jgi/Botrbrau1/5878/Bobra.0366s0056.1